MAESATSIMSKPMDRLARLVASSATFRTVVGAASEAAALSDSIHYPSASDEHATYDDDDNPPGNAIHPWPRAIIEQGPKFSHAKVGTGLWSANGDFFLTFQFEIPTTDDANEQTQQTWFLNRAGTILAEMEANAAQGTSVSGETHLDMIGYELQDGPDQEPPLRYR